MTQEGQLQPTPEGQASHSTPATDLAFAEQSAAFAGGNVALADSVVGYVDSAIVRTQVRFRFDAEYDYNRPDRAEFYYTTWQLFGGQNPNPPVGFPEPQLDRQAFWHYLEYALTNRLSVAIDVPYVLSNPLVNVNDEGFGDMEVSVKYAILQQCDQHLTFQLKNHIPLEDATEHWLGTGHYSIEPGLLYNLQVNPCWTLEAELKDWISIDGAVNPFNGEDYAGNVLRYGIGLGYNLIEGSSYRVTPIVETVGWTVLDGQVFEFDANNNPLGPAPADGDTIVNMKLGARIANYCGGSLYAGWGHALTGDRWYENIFRLELRKVF